MLDWSEFKRRIDEAERVMLTTHVRPDGDALGSELAMRNLLEKLGKRVEIFNPSPTPSRYGFLDPQRTVGWLSSETPAPRLAPDLIVVLDTGTWSQLPGLRGFFEASPAAKVVVDHHRTQDDLGALRLVDTSASACGMLVYAAFRALEVAIDADAAGWLFVAIATDTGWLHHSNSTPEVFAALGELTTLGAKPHELYRQIYECNSLGRLRLLGRLLQRIELRRDGRLAWAQVSRQDIADSDAHPMDTEDFIAQLMGVAGVESAVFFVEQAGGRATKISFRSRSGADCSKFAERYGGGGHQAAAGATVEWPLAAAVERVLPAAEAELVVA
jgi:phosphoesterase RecJ-like protein